MLGRMTRAADLKARKEVAQKAAASDRVIHAAMEEFGMSGQELKLSTAAKHAHGVAAKCLFLETSCKLLHHGKLYIGSLFITNNFVAFVSLPQDEVPQLDATSHSNADIIAVDNADSPSSGDERCFFEV